jgi:hypothetical protein
MTLTATAAQTTAAVSGSTSSQRSSTRISSWPLQAWQATWQPWQELYRACGAFREALLQAATTQLGANHCMHWLPQQLLLDRSSSSMLPCHQRCSCWRAP